MGWKPVLPIQISSLQGSYPVKSAQKMGQVLELSESILNKSVTVIGAVNMWLRPFEAELQTNFPVIFDVTDSFRIVPD